MFEIDDDECCQIRGYHWRCGGKTLKFTAVGQIREFCGSAMPAKTSQPYSPVQCFSLNSFCFWLLSCISWFLSGLECML